MNQPNLFDDLTEEEIDVVLNRHWYDEPREKIKELTCDCGCDKVYGRHNIIHSTWCSKYKKE